MWKFKSALMPISVGAVVALAAEAALPPDTKLSAQVWFGLPGQRQQDYAAGVADGLALGAFGAPEQIRHLRLCMNGYTAQEIAALASSHGPALQSQNHAGAVLIGLVMARECQLQWTPR